MKAILKKMHAISKDVGYIQKDSKNQHHGYTYASERAIKEAMHKAFMKHGVVMQLETADVRVLDGFEPTRQGKEQKAIVIDCVYRFIDVDTAEQLEGKFVACGPARDDKGLWAATTSAIKYILTTTFLIPTGDDAESDTNHPAPNHPKTPDSSTDAKPAPVEGKRAFMLAWDAACKRTKTVPLKAPIHCKALIVLLCNRNTDIQPICIERGWEAPFPDMAAGSSGWLVLAELVNRIASDPDTVKAFAASAMLAKQPKKASA